VHRQGTSRRQLIQQQVAMVGQPKVASNRITLANQSEALSSDLRM
jgi:hypothetical protein